MNFEDLLSMPLEESEALLEDFMASEVDFIKAPNYLKEEISTKCYKSFICVKQMQLFTYSVKVCAAVAFALMFLFSISPTEFTYPSNTSIQEIPWQEDYIEDMKDNFVVQEAIDSNKCFDTVQQNESCSTERVSKVRIFIFKLQEWFQNYKKNRNQDI